MKKTAFGLMAVMTASAAFAADVDPALIKRARAALSNELLDPYSAQFHDLYVVKKGSAAPVLCGAVNAKNSLGAYTGKKAFFYVDSKQHPKAAVEGQPFFVAFEMFCKP